jgi:hypothetical protein
LRDGKASFKRKRRIEKIGEDAEPIRDAADRYISR